MTVFGSIEDDYATWDAAYVLGALSAGERREYETHLQTCAPCRGAVADLSGMPGLLAKVELSDVCALDEESALDPNPPAEMLESVLGQVRSRRRRTRRLTALAGVAAAVLLAVALVIAMRPGIVGPPAAPETSAQGAAMTEVSPTPINATVGLTGYGWGTRIDMACSYGDWGARDVPPQQLGMVVVGRDGSRSQIATWLGISGATALPSATTPLQPDEIAAVQMVSVDSGTVLLETQL